MSGSGNIGNEFCRRLLDALRGGSLDDVMVVLADPNDIDSVLSGETYEFRGYSVLAVAVEFARVDAVRALLENGADPNKTITDAHWNRAGESPLMLACAPLLGATPEVRLQLVERLLSAGADPDRFDTDDMSALGLAAAEGLPRVVAALLRAGADPNALYSGGRTALHSACMALGEQREYPATVALLVAAGADVHVADEDGVTPRELAERTDDPELIAALNA